MRIEIHYSSSNVEAHVLDDMNKVIAVIPQYDINGIPSELFQYPHALPKYLNDCYVRLSQFSDNSYGLRINPRLKGGGGGDLLVSGAMIVGGSLLTIFTGGWAVVPGAALVGGGIKGGVHAWKNEENFTGGYFKSVGIGGVTGAVGGGISALGPVAGEFITAAGFAVNPATVAITVNATGSAASRTIEAKMEGESLHPLDVASAALIGGVATGIQIRHADKIKSAVDAASTEGNIAKKAIKTAFNTLKDTTKTQLSKEASSAAKVVAREALKESFVKVVEGSTNTLVAGGKVACEFSKVALKSASAGATIEGTNQGVQNKMNKKPIMHNVGKKALQGAARGVVQSLNAQANSNSLSSSHVINAALVPVVSGYFYQKQALNKANEEIHRLENQLEEAIVQVELTERELEETQLDCNATAKELKSAKFRLFQQEKRTDELMERYESVMEEKMRLQAELGLKEQSKFSKTNLEADPQRRKRNFN